MMDRKCSPISVEVFFVDVVNEQTLTVFLGKKSSAKKQKAVRAERCFKIEIWEKLTWG